MNSIQISKKFFLLFITAFILLFLSFSSTIFIESAHHDNTRYFRGDNSIEFKSNCNNDGQYGWLNIIGRPLTAKIECQVFKHTHSLKSLSIMRVGVIAILALASTILGLILIRFGFDYISASFTSIAIFTLPGVQNTVFMTNFPNAIVPTVALSLFLLLSLKEREFNISSPLFNSIKFLIAIVFLFITMLIYPGLSFIYFWGTLIVILFSILDNKVLWLKVTIRDLIIFFIASLIYLLFNKFFIPDEFKAQILTVPEQFKPDLSIVSLFNKTPLIFSDIIPTSLSLWFKTSGIFSSTLLIVIISTLLFFFTVSNRKKDLSNNRTLINSIESKLIASFFIFLATILPLILSKIPQLHQRILFPSMGALLIIVLFLVPIAIEKIFKNDNILIYSRRVIASFALIIGLLMSNWATTLNVWNTNIEMEFVRQQLAKYEELPRRIHIIRAIDNNVGFNGLKFFSDEFNRKTTDYIQDIPDFIELAINGSKPEENVYLSLCNFTTTNCEVVVPKNRTILSISDYGESFCKTNNMALIDLNILVKSTNTGKPNILSMDSISSCKNNHLVYTNTDSSRHGVHKAFDNSIAPDDFWEASMSKPIFLEINYNTPTIVTSYKISSGETAERMPIKWNLFASNDKKSWNNIDSQDNIYWNSNEKKTFYIKDTNHYLNYKLVIEKSVHPKIMRLYEIKFIAK